MKFQNKIKSKPKRNWRKISYRLLFSLFIIILILSLYSVNKGREIKETTKNEKFPKLLILGIDAATWDIIDPLIEAGQMPYLKKIIDAGVSGTPPTQNPTISPAIWTTVATGKLPAKHGVRNFLATAHDYEPRFVGSDARTTKALWNILSEQGDKIGLFSWWATWPPEDINGYVVTDLALLEPEDGIYPENLRKGIINNSIFTQGLNLLKGGFNLELPKPTDLNDENFFKIAHNQFNTLNKLFITNSLYTFDDQRPDVLMEINGAIDASQHLFLKFLRPEEMQQPVDPKLVAKYGNFLNELYAAQDRMIGEYLKRSGPETNIIIMSDHGVFIDPASGYRVTKFNVLLSNLGLLSYNPDGSINYAKTTAFECNNNTFDWQRRLCLNLENRYAYGTVPQNKFNQVRDLVIEKLNSVKTPEGQSLFLSITPSDETEADVKYDISRDLSDSLIMVNGTYRTVREYLSINIESGNHYADPIGPAGIFAWKGPNIKEGKKIELNYEDITPTILTALGLPVGKDMDGRVLSEIFVKPPKITYIDTYDDTPTTLTTSALESIEENDLIKIDGLKASITSEIKGSDEYDQFCLDLAHQSNLDLNVIKAENSPLTTNDGPLRVKNQIPLTKYLPIKDLPIKEEVNFSLNNFPVTEEDRGKFNYQVPLDFNKPSVLNVWSNYTFSFFAPSDGFLSIVAKSDPVNKIGAIIEINNRGRLETAEISTDAYHDYEFPVHTGQIFLSYINDDKANGQDRNLFIQAVKFSTQSFKGNKKTEFYRRNGDLCLTNTTPGYSNFEFEVIKTKENRHQPESTEKALELLQDTGNIEE